MPVIAGLHLLDYVVLACYLMAMIGIGLYFSREQHGSQDFFLAGRSMSWFPVGLSVMATLLSALSYTGIPGEAYHEGLKFLLMPVAVWLTLPVLSRFVLPLYQGLQLYSVYEYLELRYDAATRMLSSLVFVVWRLLWLGGVLYAPCKVLVVAAGLDIPMWFLLIVLGLVSTLYTFLGGMKAVIWTDVIQSLVMVGGLVLIIGGIWSHLDGGPVRVWQIAADLGRTDWIDTEFSWSSKWSVWGILPHFWLAMLSFYVADQITAQRFLTAKDVRQARRSFVLNCVSVTIMVPALMYVGMSLLAFYHDDTQRLQARWVVNLDNQTRQPIADPADPEKSLLDWSQDIDPPSIAQLVAEGRILQPNSKQPFTDVDQLLRREGDRQVIDVDKLVMRLPPADATSAGEVVLNSRAQDELMPRFITNRLPIGVAGLILAALLAASMSSMDSGLNSICTLLVMDFHRQRGWGRAWWAARRGKTVEQLGESDELVLGRWLVIGIGVLATLFSILVSQIDNIFTIMISVVNTFGGPLLSIFLLGIFSRRVTATAAVWSLLAGTGFTLWLTAANSYPALAWLWPFPGSLNGIWPLSLGVAFTLICGWLLGWLVGQPKSKAELRGLVWRLGSLGDRRPPPAHIAIDEPPDDTPAAS